MSPQQETKLHFLDYWRIIRIRKTVIIAVFLLVVLTATLVTLVLPEAFSSNVRIKVERDVPNVPTMGEGSAGRGVYDPYFLQTEMELIQSEMILTRAVQELNLNVEWGKKYNGGVPLKTSESIKFLRSVINVSPDRNTFLINIRAYSDTAEEAAKVANAVAKAYADYRREENETNMTSGISALNKRLQEQYALIQLTASNVDHQRRLLNISDPDPMSEGPTASLSADLVRQIQGQLVTAEHEQVRIETTLRKLRELTPNDLRAAIQTAVGTDSELGPLLSELNLAEQRLLSLEKVVTPENADYIAAKRMRDHLDEKVSVRVNGILIGLENRLEQTKAQVDALNKRLADAREVDQKAANDSRPYYDAKRELAMARQFYNMLQLKIAAHETDKQIPVTMVDITDPARPNPEPVRPKKALNIGLGIVIGLVVGIGLAFFIEYLDTSVKTIDDVERTLQAPVLGVIPQNVGFLFDEGAESPHAEAYRVLRTNLLFSRKDEKLNSVAVVSAGAGEGKSTTVFNLATVFAQNGSRVVIVDSDLRRPTLHKMVGVTNSIGLTNYLLKQNKLEEVVQTTSLPTLDFMASGKLPSSSMGILSSVQMRELIAELKARYDFVFFDSPPIMGVSDASVLASEVDMTLQVIQYRRYPQPMNIRAKQMIEKVGGNLVGIVLNNINVSQDESYYYYSGYYQEYYSKSEEAAGTETPEAGTERKA